MSEVWLVTGANRGLGLEWARQLAARGKTVIATARKPAEARELRALDVRIEPLDVADPSSVAELVRRLGGETIDGLVNNAGRGGAGQTFDALDWGEVARAFQVNAAGPMRLAQALLPNMKGGSRKLIVNVTSRMGSIEDNSSGGYYSYRASKAALNMLNKTLSIELARAGFTTVVIHPGWVATEMGGAGAPLTTAQSVKRMLGVVEGLGPKDTGKFYDLDGQSIPW